MRGSCALLNSANFERKIFNMQWKPPRIDHLERSNDQSDLNAGGTDAARAGKHMRGKPIHENLSTAFVNFPALVRHLRGLQFVGTVRLEFASYEAEIFFTPAGRIQAREYDRLAGRIAQGERAFRRVLDRAKDPTGRVHVLPAGPKETAARMRKTFVDDRLVSLAREAAFGRADTPVAEDISAFMPRSSGTANNDAADLATELILIVKDPFDRAKMDFPAAFAAACRAAADEFPYLASAEFDGGRLKTGASVPTAELFGGVTAALAHMIRRLRADAKFGKLLIYTRHRLLQHLSAQHERYSRLGLLDTVDRILG